MLEKIKQKKYLLVTIGVLTVCLVLFLTLINAVLTNPEVRYSFGWYRQSFKISNKTYTTDTTKYTQVAKLPVIKSFSASKYSVNAGESATLSWSVSGASRVTISQNVGRVSRWGGSVTVKPTVTTTYTLMAQNRYGSMITADVTVEVLTVKPAMPTATFVVAPSSINYGETAELKWTTTDASAVTIDHGVGEVYPSSSMTIKPTTTTTYTLVVTNSAGSVTKNATVTVNLPAAPTASFSVTPSSITSGSSAILTWSTANASNVSIDQNIGSVSISGTKTIAPSTTTTYILTASNVSGVATRSVTVSVSAQASKPTITAFTASPTSITAGQSTNLSWSVENATSVSINQNVGSVSGATGTKTVSPTVTTTYTLTAVNVAGTVTKDVTVTVTTPTPPPSSTELKVTDYGANGTDSNDDTSAFNNAMTAAVTKGATLRIPAGTYKVSGLTFKAGLVMKGDGESSFINGSVHINTNNKISYLKLGASGYSVDFVATVSGTYLDHITFIGGVMNDEYGPVVEIDRTMTDTHFYDCVVETNVNGRGNGISIIDNGVPQSSVTNIEFLRLHVLSQPRMDFEMIGREFYGARTLPYHHITVKDSVFETSGAESLSFDCNGVATDVLVENNVFKGSGTSTTYTWHQTLEFNKTTNSIVRGNTFYRADGWWLNFNSANMLVENNIFDSSVNNINMIPTGSGKEAMGGTCNTCTFQGNKFVLAVGGAYTWWEKFINSKIINNTFTDTRSSAGTFYFSNGSTGSTVSDNTFITNSKPSFSISSDSSVTVANNIYKTPSGTLIADKAIRPKGFINGLRWTWDRMINKVETFWERLINNLFQ